MNRQELDKLIGSYIIYIDPVNGYVNTYKITEIDNLVNPVLNKLGLDVVIKYKNGSTSWNSTSDYMDKGTAKGDCYKFLYVDKALEFIRNYRNEFYANNKNISRDQFFIWNDKFAMIEHTLMNIKLKFIKPNDSGINL